MLKRVFFGVVAMSLFCANSQTVSNKLDEKGQKHGLWKGKHEDTGRLRYEGVFEHGKETGTFKFYANTPESNLIATKDFNVKNDTVYNKFYDLKKNVVSEGKSVKKLNEGEWRYYHKDTQDLMTTENYRAGKLDGMRCVYYKNGKIAEECCYKNGIKDGIYKKYTDNGAVLESTNYRNGKYDGAAVFNAVNGAPAGKGMYRDGKKVGVWEFYEGGKLKYKENMDKPHAR